MRSTKCRKGQLDVLRYTNVWLTALFPIPEPMHQPRVCPHCSDDVHSKAGAYTGWRHRFTAAPINIQYRFSRSVTILFDFLV